MKNFIYSTRAALSLSSMAAARNPPAIRKILAEANGYLILHSVLQ
jgi:hypothetical protein